MGGGVGNWETRNKYKILVMKPEVKTVSARPGHSSVDPIKMQLSGLLYTDTNLDNYLSASHEEV